MSKYNVGDVVKLRDDLEVGKKYNEMGFYSRMKEMQNVPIKITNIDIDEDYETEYNWYINDEMIEGLWEECKGITYEPYEEKTNKLKLIDVLNMIAKGELKEGTKVKYLKNIYIYKKYEGKNYASLYREEADNPEKDLFYDERYVFITVILNNEVELIEPPCEHEWEVERIRNGIGDVRVFRRCVKCGFREEAKDNHFADVGKMVEELKYDDFWAWDAYSAGEDEEEFIGSETAIKMIFNKLNEVINKVNAQTEVILAQRKDIDEIKEQLDY